MGIQSNFLKKHRCAIVAQAVEDNILPSLTAAQLCLESGNGTTKLFTRYNNGFGIKGTFKGQGVDLPTQEFINGSMRTVKAKFRVYPKLEDSIKDHNSLFYRLERYRNLRGCQDYLKATQFIQQDGYATDPKYTQKLRKIIENNNLLMWDLEAGFYRNIYINCRGEDVKHLQRLLNNLNYNLSIDGIFGSKTKYAVENFQKKSGLAVDGIVGKNTKDRLKYTYNWL